MASPIPIRSRCSTRRAMLCSVLCAGLQLLPAGAPAAPPVVSEAAKRAVRARVDYGYNPGITVGIVNPDGRAYFSHGTTSFDGGMTPDEHTLYEVGSITKVFTATLLADMVARGEVSLDTPVADLLPPGVRAPTADGGGPILLRHLATHTSGLPTNQPAFAETSPTQPFADFTQDAFDEFLGNYVLPREPGASWEYSNLGVGLLGYALAQRLGTTYEAALQERVLGPLGLDDTVVTPDGDQLSRFADGYFEVIPRDRLSLPSIPAAGTLLASASDLLDFLEFQLGISDAGALAAPIASTQAEHFSGPGLPGAAMGLGWFMPSLEYAPGRTVALIYHDGATMGQTAFAGINPATQTGVVALTNTRLNLRSMVTELGLKMLAPQIGTPEVQPRPYPLELDAARAYFGRYVSSGGDWMDLDVLLGRVTLAHSGSPEAVFSLVPVGQRAFALLNGELEIDVRFSFDAGDRPAAMRWQVAGETVVYRKTQLPTALEIRTRDGQVELSVRGDTGVDFVIESSPDGRVWTTSGTRTIWDPAYTEQVGPGSRTRLFRARDPR